MENHLPHYQIRPRFKVDISLSLSEIEERLKHSISKDGAAVQGTVIAGHATLNLPQGEIHYWSPQLSLSFEDADGQSCLRGMYSPRPSVWTMFVLFYSVIGFAIFIISIVGYSNWSLGQPATILWSVPVLMVVFLSIYLVSYMGQKAGKKQMIILHSFVEESLGIQIQER